MTVARFVLCASLISLWTLSAGSGRTPAGLLLFAAALSVAGVARWRRERFRADHLNRWDEAAGFLALAGLAGAFGL